MTEPYYDPEAFVEDDEDWSWSSPWFSDETGMDNDPDTTPEENAL